MWQAPRWVASASLWLKRPLARAGLVLLGGGVLSGLAAVWQAQQNQASAASHFEALAQSTVAQLSSRLAIYESGLRGARGAVLAAGFGQLDRQHFRAYAQSRQIDTEFPGARGFGVMRRVAPADETAFEAAARQDGWPDFAVRQIYPYAGERYVIEFIEPIESNAVAVGLDMASEANRRAAAQQAMRTGTAVLTEPLTLRQNVGKPQGSFLLLLPIYRPSAALDSAQAREAAAQGWSFTVLLIEEMLKNIDLQGGQLAMSLRDVSGANVLTFYNSPVKGASATGLRQRIRMPVYGRVWEADIRALPLFLQQLDPTPPELVAMVGLVMSLLLAALAYIREKSVLQERLVRQERSRRASMVDYSSDAIIGESLDGRVTDWNPAAERLFGYTAAQVLQRPLAVLLLPPERAAEDAAVVAAMARGEVLPPFDTTRMRSDGRLIDVSVTASPIMDADGHLIGFAKTIRDISQTRRAEIQARELNADLEQQVRERTALLETATHDLQGILDAVPSLIGYWDRNLFNRVANRAYETWFGLEPGMLHGRSLKDLLGDELYRRNRPHIEAALAGQTQVFERTVRRPDRSVHRHSLTHYLPDVVDGVVQGFYVLVNDVSELVEGRQKLTDLQRENDALLRTIHLHAIVSVADRAGRITEVNDAFCRISGYDRAELLGQNHRMVRSDVQDTGFWTAMWRTVSGGQAWRGEVCNRAKDGSLYWVDSVIAPFNGADGQIEKYVSIRTDITAAKQLEQELRASQAFLDRASRMAKVGAWQLDLDPLQVTWSPELARIHEVGPDYRIGLEDGLNFYVPEARPLVQAAVQQAMDTGQGWDLEVQLRTAAGRLIWVRVLGEAELEQGRTVRLVGVMQDVTARKQVEMSLASERHLMTSLLNTVPDQIYFKDRASRFLRINPGLAQRYGLADAAEAIGRSDADYFLPAHAAATAVVEQQIMDTGVPVIDLEEQELWPDRPPTWNLSTKMPLRDPQGQVIGLFGISRDITARKKIESELYDTNLRFEMAAAGAGLGVWELDLVQQRLHWDARVFQLFGVSAASGEAPLEIWARCLHPEDRARYQAHTDATVRGEHDLDIEFRILRADGEVRYLKAAARVQRDAQGTPLRLTGVNFDITEHKRAELRLLETTLLLQNVLESASEVAIIATDKQMLIRMFNVGAERLLGYSSGEMVGRETPALLHDAEEVYARSQEMSEQLGYEVLGNAVFTDPSTLQQPREWTYLRKDGSRVRVSLVTTAMRSADGSVFGYLDVAHDVTRQKQVELSLREAIHKARQTSLAKSQFLANMSHEIRTPMNAVMGLSYLLAQTALDAEQADLLDKIRLASQSLLVLINDVLDLSKIEANEMVIEQAPFDLHAVLHNASELMAVQAAAKGLDFQLDLPARVPQFMEGDAARLQQILVNILSNAVKFTEHGAVRTAVKRLPAKPGCVRLRFTVCDTGMGISAEVRARLFVPFAQADASTTRRFGGTGLGLSIVKHLVSLMGGQLGLHSTEGVGSEFWWELDFRVVSTQQARGHKRIGTAERGRGLAGMRVLVVDDSDINQEVAKRILGREGAEVTLAGHGREAIDKLRAQPDAFDVVLMDVQMPELDGLSATRIIRQEMGLTALPIIALTAGAMLEEHQNARAAGMNDFVAKPFEVQNLVRIIRLHVPMAATVRGAAPAPAGPAPDAAAWPEIQGVEAGDAQVRLGGDLALFYAMLKRLLREFHEVKSIPDPWDASSLATLEQRMHKLKGSAGMLGVNQVQQLADAAERACHAGDAGKALQWARKIEQHLQALQQSAAPLLRAQAQQAAEAPAEPAPALAPQALLELCGLLRQQNMHAVERFNALTPQLKPLLTAAQYAQLREHIDSLQFGDALAVLNALPA